MKKIQSKIKILLSIFFIFLNTKTNTNKMFKRRSNLTNWINRFMYKIKWGYLYIVVGSFVYLIAFYFRHYICDLLGWHPVQWIKLIFSALNNFLIHYFPDLVAAGTIYLFIDEGLKVLIGTREEKKRSYKRVLHQFKNAKREIQILDTFINNFITEVSPEKFKEFIFDRIKDDIEVKILLLNPDTEAADQRITDLKSSPFYKDKEKKLTSQIFHTTVFLWELQEELKEISKVKGDLYGKGNSLSIKLYNKTPPMAYYAWDDTAYFSLITPNSLTEQNPNLIISKLTLFGKYASDIFEKIWNDVDGKNPTININKFMVSQLAEEELNNTKIRKDENEIYFGYHENKLKDYPCYLITKRNNDNLIRFLKNKKDEINVKHHSKIHKVMIKSVLEFENNGDAYIEAMNLINKLYNFDTKNKSIKRFGHNPLVFEIDFIKENIETEI